MILIFLNRFFHYYEAPPIQVRIKYVEAESASSEDEKFLREQDMQQNFSECPIGGFSSSSNFTPAVKNRIYSIG